MDGILELISATGKRSGRISVHCCLRTMPARFGPTYVGMILDPAPMGTVPPKLPSQVLPELEHKQPRTRLDCSHEEQGQD